MKWIDQVLEIALVHQPLPKADGEVRVENRRRRRRTKSKSSAGTVVVCTRPIVDAYLTAAGSGSDLYQLRASRQS